MFPGTDYIAIQQIFTSCLLCKVWLITETIYGIFFSRNSQYSRSTCLSITVKLLLGPKRKKYFIVLRENKGVKEQRLLMCVLWGKMYLTLKYILVITLLGQSLHTETTYLHQSKKQTKYQTTTTKIKTKQKTKSLKRMKRGAIHFVCLESQNASVCKKK